MIGFVIVYESDIQGFRDDVLSNRIEERIYANFVRANHHSVSKSEVQSWKNSLAHMDRVLADASIPDSAGVAVEFTIPGSTKRIDFVVTGFGPEKQRAAVIVELKQWTEATLTTKDAIVETFVGGGRREVNHPSYQAWSYATLLTDFNEAVRSAPIHLHPCAYLHNCESPEIIRNDFYREHVAKAPAFLKDDAVKLRAFIRDHIRYGDKKSVIVEILNGTIRPSKNLADSLVALLKKNPEFTLIDDQKLVYETALALAKKAQTGKKQVLIVEGGPGTGKTVVAVNLLVRLTEGRLNVRYVTKNAAPRAVYEAKLKGHFKKTAISNLFSGPDRLHTVEADTFGVLVVDEAHRLREKSGIFSNLGENQILEAIRASRCCVFFVDDAQKVSLKDIGSIAEIRRLAKKESAEVTEAKLESQFRCNGSDGFLGWIDHTLGIRATANTTLEGVTYDFRVCESASQLRELIESRNRLANKARMVAGYCWPWKSKKDKDAKDIVFPEGGFAAQWNLQEDGGTWIMRPDSVKQIGCIHTCQGLEVDYVGVIIGHDYVVRDGKWVAFPERRAKEDQTMRGFAKLLLNDRLAGQRRIEEIIRNTYRTLMTRGARGCYVFSVDKETNAYLSACMGAVRQCEESLPLVDEVKISARHPFRVLAESERERIPSVRLFPNLKAAAGAFQTSVEDDCEWVELTDSFRPSQDLFIVQVKGESMNRRIPNGSWCLFNRNTKGSRQEKIVLVKHAAISDPENGGSYTVKRYRSMKRLSEGEWSHETITLWPESNDRSFLPIHVSPTDGENFAVIGEFVAVLA